MHEEAIIKLEKGYFDLKELLSGAERREAALKNKVD